MMKKIICLGVMLVFVVSLTACSGNVQFKIYDKENEIDISGKKDAEVVEIEKDEKDYGTETGIVKDDITVFEPKIEEKEELPELEFDEDKRAISLSTGSTNWEKYELATESAMGGPGKWYKPYTDFEVRGGKVYLKDIGYSHQPADGKVYIRLKANPDAGYNSIRIKEEGIEMPEFDGEVVDLGADWKKFEVATDSVDGRPGTWYEPAGREVTVNKLYKLNGKIHGNKSAEYIFVKYDGEIIAEFEIEQKIEMPKFDGEVVDLGADWSKFEVATDSPRGSGRPGSWYTPAGRKVTLNKLYKLSGITYGDKSAEYIFVKYDGEIIGEFEIEREEEPVLEIEEVGELPELEFDEELKVLSVEGNDWDKYELKAEHWVTWYDACTNNIPVRSNGKIYIEDTILDHPLVQCIQIRAKK